MTGPLDGFAPVLRGAWTIEPAADQHPLSFGIAPAGPTDLVWRVLLPADTDRASADLALTEATTTAAAVAPGVALMRLATFTRAPIAAGSYSLGVAGRSQAAESDLEVGLAQLRAWSAPRSFGVGERIEGYWEAAVEAFQAAMGHVRALLTGQVRVETVVDGTLMACTVVRWAGDTVTSVRGPTEAPHAGLHLRSLRAAAASRATMLRTVTTVISGAALLAAMPALLASPAGFLLALPAAWRFVNHVIGELVPG